VLFQQLFYVHATREKLPKQNSHVKFVRKMLMKLTAGVDFNKHFMHSFYAPRSQKCNKDCDALTVFCALGICARKSFELNVGDIDPWCRKVIKGQIFHVQKSG